MPKLCGGVAIDPLSPIFWTAAKKAMKLMGAKNAVYCGDSAEDLLMARRAQEETGLQIAFVGLQFGAVFVLGSNISDR